MSVITDQRETARGMKAIGWAAELTAAFFMWGGERDIYRGRNDFQFCILKIPNPMPRTAGELQSQESERFAIRKVEAPSETRWTS